MNVHTHPDGVGENESEVLSDILKHLTAGDSERSQRAKRKVPGDEGWEEHFLCGTDSSLITEEVCVKAEP